MSSPHHTLPTLWLDLRSAPLIGVAVLLLGCDKTPGAACALPVIAGESGCPQGQSCTLDAKGQAACWAPGRLAEGASCDPEGSAEEGVCGEKMACVLTFGHWRCLRLCDSEGIQPCSTDGSQATRCRAVLIAQPELGVCLPVCSLELAETRCPDGTLCDPQDAARPCPDGAVCAPATEERQCPEGTACTVPFGVGFAVCATVGEQQADALCGAESKCAAGLVCTPTHGSARCRRPRAPEGCSETRYTHCLHGVAASATGTEAPHAICVPCRATGLTQIDGRALAVCETTARCLAEGGTVGRAADGVRLTEARVSAAIARVFGGTVVQAPGTSGACADSAVERCDGLDQDCDGLIDEDAPCDMDRVCAERACRGRCGPDACAATEICVDGLCLEFCAVRSHLESALVTQRDAIQTRGVVVAALSTSEGWMWPALSQAGTACGQRPVDEEAWGSAPLGGGDCVVLAADGRLEATTACGGPTLCALGTADGCAPW